MTVDLPNVQLGFHRHTIRKQVVPSVLIAIETVKEDGFCPNHALSLVTNA